MFNSENDSKIISWIEILSIFSFQFKISHCWRLLIWLLYNSGHLKFLIILFSIQFLIVHCATFLIMIKKVVLNFEFWKFWSLKSLKVTFI